MNAAGRTLTLAELTAEAPWPEQVQVRIELSDGYRLAVDRVEAQGDQLILFAEHEPGQEKLNRMVADLKQILDLKLSKTELVEQLTAMYAEYEVETT